MPKEISAGAVIFRRDPPSHKATEGQGNNKIYYLLLHYGGSHWDFPKGHIEEGEKEEDTVKREVREETGIKDIKIINGFKEWVKYFFRRTYNFKKGEKKKAPWIFKIVTFYLAETKTKEVKISSEHEGFKWLLYGEAFKQLKFKNAKNILEKANNFIVSKKI